MLYAPLTSALFQSSVLHREVNGQCIDSLCRGRVSALYDSRRLNAMQPAVRACCVSPGCRDRGPGHNHPGHPGCSRPRCSHPGDHPRCTRPAADQRRSPGLRRSSAAARCMSSVGAGTVAPGWRQAAARCSDLAAAVWWQRWRRCYQTTVRSQPVQMQRPWCPWQQGPELHRWSGHHSL